MKTIFALILLTLSVFAPGQAQRGYGGGMGGSAGPDELGLQNQRLQQYINDLQTALSRYLTAPEIKAILTPGEYVEWKLTLKPSQVVVAEASSEAFDPALEVVDDKGVVLAKNDDRYPGDQRPLLLWRCEKEGTYSLHVRCFHDKSGGSFLVRYQIFPSYNLQDGKQTEFTLEHPVPFLLSLHMKAGQIEQIIAAPLSDSRYLRFDLEQIIAPDGLPVVDPRFSLKLAPPLTESQGLSFSALVAPVEGDYYFVGSPNMFSTPSANILVTAKGIVPVKLTKSGSQFSATSPTGEPAIWEVSARKGELLEASTPGLSVNSSLVFTEKPDISKFDLDKPDENPFFPHLPAKDSDDAFENLPGRAQDHRKIVFWERRDATIWLISDAIQPDRKMFSIEVRAAAQPLAEEKTNSGTLRIADTNYWSFPAETGDVIRLNSKTTGFEGKTETFDPDLKEVSKTVAAPDQTSKSWSFMAKKPGRYLVAVSCVGDGGSGTYSLTRGIVHPKEISIGNPARGEISKDDIQAWRFTVTPDHPRMIHWKTSEGTYEYTITDEKGGSPGNLYLEPVDNYNQFGIISVRHPQTYVFVLTGREGKVNYSFELLDLPGYKKP